MLWAFGTVVVDDGECQLVHKFFLKEVHKSTPEVEVLTRQTSLLRGRVGKHDSSHSVRCVDAWESMVPYWQ